MVQSSNTIIIPYEDSGVLHHDFDNMAVVAEDKKAKTTEMIVMGLDLVEKEALMICHTQKD